MTTRARRKHSSAFKAKMALDAVRGDRTLAELAKLHRLELNSIHRHRHSGGYACILATHRLTA